MTRKLFLVFAFIFYTFALFSQEIKPIVNSDSKSISVIKTINQITVYPNPFSYKTKVSFNSTIPQTVFFRVKNIIGKTIYTKKISAKKGVNTLDFHKNNILNGMYLYTLQTDHEIVSKRFVIK